MYIFYFFRKNINKKKTTKFYIKITKILQVKLIKRKLLNY